VTGQVSPRVLVVGDADMDILLTGLPGMPVPEQEVLAQQLTAVVGGQAATLARALARLSLQVTLVGKVGDDDHGRRVLSQLAADGVDVSAMLVDPSVPTGVTVVLSTGTERAYATYLGTTASLCAEEVPGWLLAGADHLHVGSFYLQPALRPGLKGLFRAARAAGLTTSLDPGWDPLDEWLPDILDVLDQVDVFIPNLVEALAISRAATPLEAMSRLGKHARRVVVKTGAQGCLVWQQGRSMTVPGFVVPVKDVTSAGDVFNAGFLYGFLCGWDAGEAARFANACGAMAVGRVGSDGVVPGVEQVREFLANHT
jgi:sugar/nucleoside kinase (ribokinase family)